MQIQKGCVVKSISGRDRGRFYVIYRLEGNTAFIADGEIRKIEKVKKKNLKHLQPTLTVIEIDEFTTNKQLKFLLKPFNGLQQEDC